MAVWREIDHMTYPNAHRVFLGLVAMKYCSIPILNACSKKIQGKKKKNKKKVFIKFPFLVQSSSSLFLSHPFLDFL